MKSNEIKFEGSVIPKDIKAGMEVAYRIYDSGAVNVAVVEEVRKPAMPSILLKVSKGASLREEKGKHVGRLLGGSADFLMVDKMWEVWQLQPGTVAKVYAAVRGYNHAVNAIERCEDLQKLSGVALEARISEVESICKDVKDNTGGYREGIETISAFLLHPKLDMTNRRW